MKVTTKAKMWAAAVGGFVTLLGQVFADDVLDMGEGGMLVSGAITLGVTVYAVWKAPRERVVQPADPSVR